MLKSYNFGDCCRFPVDMGDGFHLETHEEDNYYNLICDDEVIAVVTESCDTEETVVEILNNEYEVYGCRYCGTLMANSASIVVATKGTSHYEPCEDCLQYVTDSVAQPDFIRPEGYETIEDCVQYIITEITYERDFDFSNYFESYDDF